MTQEQKPESAEFRTREERIDGQIEDIFEIHEAEDAERVISKGDLRLMIEAAHKSAEARGAAEQSRKDAEGQEPVGYVVARLQELFTKPDNPLVAAMIFSSIDAPHIQPLYDRPANIAALEARVKELEAQIGAMQYGTVRQVIHSPLRHFKPEDRS
ncbi:hypothetical protein [Asaia astilbis]|uniref:hypothetical protein n=1 Tax=Asaia astilbis TaxID=610244 RepID=UPI00046F4594|nr:hypothetical protein [Asaia astilbis]